MSRLSIFFHKLILKPIILLSIVLIIMGSLYFIGEHLFCEIILNFARLIS